LLALFGFLCGGTALAGEPPHTIDMTKPLMDGVKPIPDFSFATKGPTGEVDCSHCPALTLGHAIRTALFAPLPDQERIDGAQKWARGTLADRIADNADATLSSEEITLIKRLVGEAYGVQVVRMVYPLIDPSAKPPAIQP
jgi:hypothetical protein